MDFLGTFSAELSPLTVYAILSFRTISYADPVKLSESSLYSWPQFLQDFCLLLINLGFASVPILDLVISLLSSTNVVLRGLRPFKEFVPISAIFYPEL